MDDLFLYMLTCTLTITILYFMYGLITSRNVHCNEDTSTLGGKFTRISRQILIIPYLEATEN